MNLALALVSYFTFSVPIWLLRSAPLVIIKHRKTFLVTHHTNNLG